MLFKFKQVRTKPNLSICMVVIFEYLIGRKTFYKETYSNKLQKKKNLNRQYLNYIEH